MQKAIMFRAYNGMEIIDTTEVYVGYANGHSVMMRSNLCFQYSKGLPKDMGKEMQCGA